MSILDVHLNIVRIGTVRKISHSQPYKLSQNDILSFPSTISTGPRTTVLAIVPKTVVRLYLIMSQ